MMPNLLKNHAEMTNAEFEKMLRQECENNKELRGEINEIAGIFLRAIIKYLNSEDCEVAEDVEE